MKALQDLIDETLARDMAALDKDMMMKCRLRPLIGKAGADNLPCVSASRFVQIPICFCEGKLRHKALRSFRCEIKSKGLITCIRADHQAFSLLGRVHTTP